MSERKITFDDGAAYERMMGTWSRIAGETFLDWLAPAKGLAWVDVGCGNGAFTESIAQRCAPTQIKGIDPSAGQIAFARSRLKDVNAEFVTGDAMALPFEDKSFDVAVMALVLFFVPDPKKGLAEMVRVTRRAGAVTAYVWDLFGGGFPADALQVELRAMGLPAPYPPSAEVSRMDNLRSMWVDAGLTRVDTRVIDVERSFVDFNDYWESCMLSSTIGAAVKGLPAGQVDELKKRVRGRFGANEGRFTASARANAVKGWVAS